MPNAGQLSKTFTRGVKLAKVFIKLVSRKSSSNPTFNPQGIDVASDAAMNIVQLVGAASIVGIFLVYKFMLHRLGKEKKVEMIEKRALLGFALGLNLASTVAKRLPKGFLSSIWNVTAGLGAGLLGAILFGCIPALAAKIRYKDKVNNIITPGKLKTELELATEKKLNSDSIASLTNTDKDKFDYIKLGIKFGSVVLTGLITLGTSLISGLNFIHSTVAAVAAFITGAIAGGKLFPSLAGYLTKKKVGTDFPERFQTGFYWGSTLGASVGAFVGSCVLPGLGTFLGSILGATIGIVALVLATTICKPIHHYLKSKTMLFGAKVGGVLGGGIGGLVFTFLIPIPVLGTSAGIAIGSLIGTVTGACITKIAANIKSVINALRSPSQKVTKQKIDSTDTLSQYKLSLSCGTLFGGLIGGLVAGPIGALAGTTIGAGLGLLTAATTQLVRHLVSRKNKDTTINQVVSDQKSSQKFNTAQVLKGIRQTQGDTKDQHDEHSLNPNGIDSPVTQPGWPANIAQSKPIPIPLGAGTKQIADHHQICDEEATAMALSNPTPSP